MKSFVNNLPVIFIKPGEFRISEQPELVTTVLGSCVTIIMYDVITTISAMSHCIFPSHTSTSVTEEYNAFRYVDATIEKMLEIWAHNKIPQSRIVVKLFGGAEQLNQANRLSVGKKNVDMALSLVEKHNLNLVAMDVGGSEGRKIYLSSHTGEVLLSRLNGIKLVKLDKVI